MDLMEWMGHKEMIQLKLTVLRMKRILGELYHTTDERLATIAGRVVPGLSIKDKLKASILIGRKVEYLEIWSTLLDEA
ncbi:hypothetical protein ACS0TY_017431 [Phlomoides rotata]